MGRDKFAPRSGLSLHSAFGSRRHAMTERPKSQREAASTIGPIVYVIDDEETMRRGLSNLFESVGLRVEAFGSAPELLQRKLPDVPSCVVLDIRLPGMSGLDFQEMLEKEAIRL